MPGRHPATRWISRTATIGAAVLSAVLLVADVAQAARHNLIVTAGGELASRELRTVARGSEGLLGRATRAKRVGLLPRVGTGEEIQCGDELVLALFDNTVLTAAVDRVTVDVTGTTTLRGRVAGSPLGDVSMSTHGGRSLASVTVPERGVHCAILYQPTSESHFLLDLSKADLDVLEAAPSLVPPAVPPGMAAFAGDPPMLDQGVDDPATINVLVVYTPAARTWADSSGGGINQVIAQAMSKAQLGHDNSTTLITKTLVHSAEVAYTESGSSSTDLGRLQNTSDGHMDEVHTWRNTYLADLVVLMTRVEDTGGIGYLLNTTAGLPTYGFSITRVQQAGWTYTTIHEMGHNMGCHHHKQQTVQPGPTSWWDWPANTWSAGWRWIGTDSGRYCSLMTYESGSYFPDGQTHTRVAYFSSPLINYAGVAAGHAADGDNRRTLREIKHVVAAYRVGPSAPTGVAATDGTYTDRARVTWNSVAGASHYRVARATSAGGAKTELGSWQTGTSYDDTGATPGVTCYYFVRAATSSGGANASDYSAYDTGWCKLSAPAGVSASDGSYADYVRVTWSASVGASHYRVYRAPSPGGVKTPLGGWQTATIYDDTSAASGVVYYYSALAAVDGVGTRPSGYSAEDAGSSLTTTSTTTTPETSTSTSSSTTSTTTTSTTTTPETSTSTSSSTTSTTTTPETSTSTSSTTTTTTTTAFAGTATHVSAGYASPGTCTVDITFTKEVGRTLAAFVYYIVPPDESWLAGGVTVSGDCSPEYSPFDGGIVLLGSLESINVTPLSLSYTMTVPAGIGGGQSLQGYIEYTYADQPGPSAVMAAPDPLPLSPRAHSADYRTSGLNLTPNWKIDTTELNRVLTIYRNLDGYHNDAGQPDKFAPGLGDRSGTTHSSDYRTSGLNVTPNWKIDTTELNRVLVIWRNLSGYHVDPTQPDGFAPGAP